MSELENLESKTDADLVQIAIAFGDFTPEEAATKSREELIGAISGILPAKKDDKPAEAKTEAAAEEAEAPAPKKRGRKKKADAEEPEQAKEEAPKKTRSSRKSAAKESDKDEAAKEEKKPAKKRSTKKVKEEKTEEAAPEAKEEAPVQAAETVEAKAPAAEEKKAEGEAKAEPSRQDRKGMKSKRRKLSFGPGQDVKQVATTEGDNPEGEQQVEEQPVEIEIEGVLSIGNPDSNKNDFCGFVHRKNYLPGDEDAYVPGQLIKRMGLRRGDFIKGYMLPKRGKEKYAPLRRVVEVNGIEVKEDNNYENIRRRPKFENLTAIYPDHRLTLETEKEDISTRIIDLFSPIGKGQRGMIVSPPKAGKTILLQKVANSITANNPNCVLIVLLIDERPEEVTDMQRNIKGEVVYSTFDKRPENHVRVTELVLERAMRLVEIGKDVVILLDSMTRLARAYNLTINPTGRTLSGGLDPGSLYGPKRFFGAARNIENGGSLTILATALIETGSRMDEVIFEEFKGTGNMEVTLDRKLADRRIFPAIAVDKSGTRREDLLLEPEELDAVWLIRRRIAEADTATATNAVISFMEKTSNNRSFIYSVKKSFAAD
ncbi:MAG: transcription termination factor Rho [Clostridiales bacterium]|nr:transcription termination factor Rho [Clostridiales bacterium]